MSSTLVLAAILVAAVVYGALRGDEPLLSLSGVAAPTPLGGPSAGGQPLQIYFSDPDSPAACAADRIPLLSRRSRQPDFL